MFNCCFRCEHADVKCFERKHHKGCDRQHIKKGEPYKGARFYCMPGERELNWWFFMPTTKKIPFEILKQRFLLPMKRSKINV